MKRVTRRLQGYLPVAVWASLLLMPLLGVALSVVFHMS
jgi:hypothetical protein